MATGTGRCGTMLLARVLGLSERIMSEHEACFLHESMYDFVHHRDGSGYQEDIKTRFIPKLAEACDQGCRYAVSSAHGCFAVPLIQQRLDSQCHIVVLLRSAQGFVRSALARGFFDPTHAHYCDQAAPHPADAIAKRWNETSPFEKCLWYWSLVNQALLRAFESDDQARWNLLHAESINPFTISSLLQRLDIRDISETGITRALQRRVNATPDQHLGKDEVNPYSTPESLGSIEYWSDEQRELLARYSRPIEDHLRQMMRSQPDAFIHNSVPGDVQCA